MLSAGSLCRSLRLGYAPLLMLGCAVLGCGGSSGPPSPERAVVTGTVTFGGEPIVVGTIHFVPENGPAAGGPITDGKYRIDSKGGVPVGTCKIEIQAFEETGEEVVISADGKTVKETEQVVPDKYNSKSQLTATIEAGRANVRDFELEQ